MPFYLCDSSQTPARTLDWSVECYPICSMKGSHRFLRSAGQHPAKVAANTVACVAEPASWTVNLECKVGADTRRIFDALTVPEYIETWICVPGHHPECRNATSRLDHGFQIEHHCISGVSTKIVGTYCSFLKRKLSFSWRPAHRADAPESFVDIRLHGDFERSILRLRHFGLESENEFMWHSALWTGSIERLCRLFERPSITDGKQRQQQASRRFERVQEPYYLESVGNQ